MNFWATEKHRIKDLRMLEWPRLFTKIQWVGLLFFFFFNLIVFTILYFIYFLVVLASLLCRSCDKTGPQSIHDDVPASHMWLPLLQISSSKACGFQKLGHESKVAIVHGPSCRQASGILPDQRLNLHPLHWQVDCPPLDHQESPR